MTEKTVLISINASWNIVNFRSGLIRALQGAGYRVVALAPRDDYSGRLDALGVDHIPLAMDSQGISPLRDLNLLRLYYLHLRRIRPDVFLGYTAKPNIYGSLAARVLGIKIINNISGLGTAFIKSNFLTRFVSRLYRLALSKSATVFFQNSDDREMFIAAGTVGRGQTRLLPGSGIDLDHFRPTAISRSEDGFRFLLIARLLWFKGVGEYVAAARLLHAKFPHVRFQLLGFIDPANPNAVGRSDVDGWVEENIIEYLGEADDVRPFIAAADCIVLPSYREGLPRTLLEAAAMGKPLIATDVPGCRQVVAEGRNGFLCAPRDAESLARTMSEMLLLSPDARAEMGAAGRYKAEAEFDERLAISLYLEAIAEALEPQL